MKTLRALRVFAVVARFSLSIPLVIQAQTATKIDALV
jgi:hypothetical protein